ncbi:MAG: RimK family alpha-L-glutamate ligase [Clostridiales bacterium]|jgi:RimK family alpha-L-glutamate ligase|nr:RimK family alpha-L-glutamate ligase [Clostridiales bacterium]
MNGILITNAYLRSPKFDTIRDMLAAAFARRGVPLSLFTNEELSVVTPDALRSPTNSPDTLRPTDEIPLRGGVTRSGGPVKRPSVLPDADFVLFWDKDILLARHLENLGYPVYNSSRAIEVCDNKALTAITLENADIPLPKTLLAPFSYAGIGYGDGGGDTFLKKAADLLSFPMIVKENFGSFGQQVYLVNDFSELKARAATLPVGGYLLQQFISSSYGRDVRIQIVGGKVAASVLRKAKGGSFLANATQGGEMLPFNPPTEFCNVALKACQAVGTAFGGVDLLFGKNDEPILCEINSNAHFKRLYEVTGVNTAEKIAEYIIEVEN